MRPPAKIRIYVHGWSFPARIAKLQALLVLKWISFNSAGVLASMARTKGLEDVYATSGPTEKLFKEKGV